VRAEPRPTPSIGKSSPVSRPRTSTTSGTRRDSSTCSACPSRSPPCCAKGARRPMPRRPTTPAEFVASIAFDGRLAAHDLAASIAHVEMLGRQKILTAAEARRSSPGWFGSRPGWKRAGGSSTPKTCTTPSKKVALQRNRAPGRENAHGPVPQRPDGHGPAPVFAGRGRRRVRPVGRFGGAFVEGKRRRTSARSCRDTPIFNRGSPCSRRTPSSPTRGCWPGIGNGWPTFAGGSTACPSAPRPWRAPRSPSIGGGWPDRTGFRRRD
jgi:hypothetical protein